MYTIGLLQEFLKEESYRSFRPTNRVKRREKVRKKVQDDDAERKVQDDVMMPERKDQEARYVINGPKESTAATEYILASNVPAPNR